MPADLDLDARGALLLSVTSLGFEDSKVLRAMPNKSGTLEERGLRFVALSVPTPPRHHGVICTMPRTLKDLCDIVRTDDFDLLETLRIRLKGLPDKKPLDAPVALILAFPKTREVGGSVESMEIKAFLTLTPLRQFGRAIGIWGSFDGQVSHLLEIDVSQNGGSIEIDVVNVSQTLSWKVAAELNGHAARDARPVVAIGAGALGSQVMVNLARGGWGKWTVIDDDVLLPHNLARHAGIGPCVGHRKAKVVAELMNMIAEDSPIASGVPCDLLRAGAFAQDIDKALGDAQVVIDMSASIPVARHVARHETRARAVSLFLSPSGRDLVVLAEDNERQLRLDHLEMLYYHALACDRNLRGHLSADDNQVRYGATCRDVSSRIPQEWIAVHAGTGAGAIRRIVSSSEACGGIWRIDSATNAVSVIGIPVEPFVSQQQRDWTVFVAPALLRAVADWRSQRLPRETGGILVGGVDHDRQAVYLTTALPSPVDSEEWPTMYIRGSNGLKTERDRIYEETAGHLDYLGEWHSHPEGSATSPSEDDATVFGWIEGHLFVDGRPPVMLICGDNNETRVFVGILDHSIPEPLWPH